MSDEMVTVPKQLLAEVEMFISNHRGITFAEAEAAVVSLRKYRAEGATLYRETQDELRLLNQKLTQFEQKEEHAP